jgi:iron complex transport system ATP-binding protein
MGDILSLKNVHFSYDGTEVLHDVTLHVPEGSFLVVVGPNGSGKTSLLRLGSGVALPQRGECLVAGRSTRTFGRRELARVVAVVPQESHIAFPFTALQVVLMGRAPHLGGLGFETAEDVALAEAALQDTDAEALRDRLLGELSGGEKQRVIIARALAQQARLLLLDEATSFLDIRHQMDICRIVRRLNRERGVTVVMVEHDLNLAAMLAERVVLLAEGRVFADGSPEEVLSEANVAQAFGVEVRRERDPATGRPILLPREEPTGGS